MDTAPFANRLPRVDRAPSLRPGSPWLDLIVVQPVLAGSTESDHVSPLLDPTEAAHIVRTLAAARFFRGPADAATTTLLQQRFPEHAGRVLSIADALANA